LYEGHYHDLLNDVGTGGVMADITSWIDARLHRDESQCSTLESQVGLPRDLSVEH
jgi:hypothetical protein